MFKSLLQGRPLGHPLHPALVHFPIGLLLLSLLLDIAAHFLPSAETIYQGAGYSLAVGLGAGLLAAATGFADWTDIRRDHPARRTANTHMLLNLAALALFALHLALRSMQPGLAAAPWLYIGLSALGIGLIFVSGYLGGTMVYDDGIGAGRHRRDFDAPEHTLRVSPPKEPGAWMYVAEASALEAGKTLRVDRDGTILALARMGDQVFAFQEFCTHRFGPMSEACFDQYEAECPWHRSRFDVRTGKVTQGPAKVDLKTFPAEIREGKIYIR